MDDVLLVQVVERLEELMHDGLELLLPANVGLCQRRSLRQLHDQPALVLLDVEVESLVAEDVGMLEPLEHQEVGLQSGDVFILEGEDLHCKGLVIRSFGAPVNDSAGTLSQFLQDLIFFFKESFPLLLLHSFLFIFLISLTLYFLTFSLSPHFLPL